MDGWFCESRITTGIYTQLCKTGNGIIGNCGTEMVDFTLDEEALKKGAAPERCKNYDYRCLDEHRRPINPDPPPCPPPSG